MRKTILIVENDMLLAVLTKLELENLGYDVLEIATTGEKAIQITREKRPNLILMDFKLDGRLDGADTAEEIRNAFDTPVIFLSGSSDPETVQRCLASKPYGYLQKPCFRKVLHQAIEQVLFQSSEPFAA